MPKPAAGGGRMRTLCIASVGPQHIFEFEWPHLVCLYKNVREHLPTGIEEGDAADLIMSHI